jgi:hypothetical protein
MTWNYRTVYRDDVFVPYNTIWRVYYDDLGNICGWSEKGIRFRGDTRRSMIESVNKMIRTANKTILLASDFNQLLDNVTDEKATWTN